MGPRCSWGGVKFKGLGLFISCRRNKAEQDAPEKDPEPFGSGKTRGLQNGKGVLPFPCLNKSVVEIKDVKTGVNYPVWAPPSFWGFR